MKRRNTNFGTTTVALDLSFEQFFNALQGGTIANGRNFVRLGNSLA
jgi:hypothetical protein